MKITFDLPRDWEVRSCEVVANKGQIVVEPRFIRNQKSANVLFATVEGAGGQKSRTIISVSGVTGAFNASTIKETAGDMAFDKPPTKAVAEPELPVTPKPPQRRQTALDSTPPKGDEIRPST